MLYSVWECTRFQEYTIHCSYRQSNGVAVDAGYRPTGPDSPLLWWAGPPGARHRTRQPWGITLKQKKYLILFFLNVYPGSSTHRSTLLLRRPPSFHRQKAVFCLPPPIRRVQFLCDESNDWSNDKLEKLALTVIFQSAILILFSFFDVGSLIIVSQ